MSTTVTLLDLARLQLRITGEDFDQEVSGLIAAAQDDLHRRGVDTNTLGQGASTEAKNVNALVLRAVMLYCKANFGLSLTEHETARNERAYENTAQALSLGNDYRQAPAGGP